MKYKDLLEFCRLIIETEADETSLRDYHVKADGPIANVWGKVYTAIQTSCDFDYRQYLQNTISMIDDEDDIGKPPTNRLN
jgi:hypothetical protein